MASSMKTEPMNLKEIREGYVSKTEIKDWEKLGN